MCVCVCVCVCVCEIETENIKYKTIFNMWKQRHLSLKGKITVINSLAASLLIYPCTTLNTPKTVIKQIDNLFLLISLGQ